VAACTALTRAYLSNMVTLCTGAAIRGRRRNYAGAYIMELDDMPVFNSADFIRICAAIRASLNTHPKTTITLTIALERKEPLRDPGCSPQIHVDQFRPVIWTLF
jgi:hypothetical protein